MAKYIATWRGVERREEMVVLPGRSTGVGIRNRGGLVGRASGLRRQENKGT